MDKDERTRKILDLIPDTLEIDSEGIDSTAIHDKLKELDRMDVALYLLRWADQYQLTDWGGQVDFKIEFDPTDSNRPYLEEEEMAYSPDLGEDLRSKAWDGIENLIERMDDDLDQIHRYEKFCETMANENWQMSALPNALVAALPSRVGKEPSHQWVARQISLLQARALKEHTPAHPTPSRAGPRL